MALVLATFSMRANGGVKVTNRGFDTVEQQWSESVAKAYFVQNKSIGHLKVSFFEPFHGLYVVFKLDSDFLYTFNTGNNQNYMWLLSRSPVISPQLRNEFIERVESKG